MTKKLILAWHVRLFITLRVYVNWWHSTIFHPFFNSIQHIQLKYCVYIVCDGNYMIQGSQVNNNIIDISSFTGCAMRSKNADLLTFQMFWRHQNDNSDPPHMIGKNKIRREKSSYRVDWSCTYNVEIYVIYFGSRK